MPIKINLFHDTLCDVKCFPHYSDPLCFRKLRNAAALDLSEALVVFISHLWHRDPEESHSCPDNSNNDAFLLCKTGLRQLHARHAALLPHCFVWLDYSCVPHPDWMNSSKHRKRLCGQNSVAVETGEQESGRDIVLGSVSSEERTGRSQLIASSNRTSGEGFFFKNWRGKEEAVPFLTYQHLPLDAVLQVCDCMFTPVVSEAAWRALEVSLACVLPEPVQGWNQTSSCYMNRWGEGGRPHTDDALLA